MLPLPRASSFLTFLLLAACGREPAAPDLILVSVDTLRADRLPFYGAQRDTGGDPEQPFTPSWLAAQGEVFESCWSPAGQTLPALASFWTGLPPLEHGAVSNATVIGAPSRLEDLRAREFAAAHALIANPVLEPGCGLERGFDSYELMFKQEERRIPEAMLERTSGAVAAGRRLLAWTHFMTPHQPYTPTAELLSRYGRGPGSPASNRLLYDLHRAGSVEPGLRAQIRRQYDAEVRQVSEQVRSFLSGLDSQYRAAGRGGLLENAIVVFFGDHGEGLADRAGYFMHAKSLYSGVIRVPLVIAGPGWVAGGRRPDPLRLEEILPLVLDGTPPSGGPFISAWQAKFYSVRDERWTLVHNPSADPDGPEEPPLDAAFPYPVLGLYDRSTDPLEQVDVAGQHPEEVARLLGELNRWYDGLEFAEARAQAADAATLSALGYAEAGGVEAEERVRPLPPAR